MPQHTVPGALFRGFLDKNPKANLYRVDTQAELLDAIDQAVSGNGDVIVLDTGAVDVTDTIEFNKSRLTVISAFAGVNPLVAGEYTSLLANASFTDGPVAKVTAPTRFIGVGFVSRDVGATFFDGAALLLGGDGDANPFGVHLLGCRFPKWGLDNRIGVAIEGSTDVLIEECSFEGVGSALEAGIYVQGACQNLTIRRNQFRQCTAAIQAGAFAGGGPHLLAHDNIVEDGKLFDSQGNSGTGLFANNFLETATDTGSYDRAVATLQGDGWQFSGNHYSE